MPKIRLISVSVSILLVLTGCTLPLIWEEVGATPEPPVVIEMSPTATDQTTGGGPVEPLEPTDTPLQPVASPTTGTEIPTIEPEPPTPLPTSTPTPVVLPYVLQVGSPVAVPNFSHPELGCDWLGIGGQVFDRRGQPQKSIVVEVGGTLAGVEFKKLVVSGGAAIYGEGGYELTLLERPIGTDRTLWIQLFDVSGEALSEKYFFRTFNDCEQNLILINFNEMPGQPFGIWLPLIDG